MAEIVFLSTKCIQYESLEEWQKLSLCLPSVVSKKAYRNGRNCPSVYQVYPEGKCTGVAEIVFLPTKCIQLESNQESQKLSLSTKCFKLESVHESQKLSF